MLAVFHSSIGAEWDQDNQLNITSKAVACTVFLKGMGKKIKGRAFLTPKRAVCHVLTSKGGSVVCFANQQGTLARFSILGLKVWQTPPLLHTTAFK